MTSTTIQSLSIVVPAFNEQHTIAETVADAVRVARDVCAEFEVVVIDDASRDATADVLRELAQTQPRLRALSRRRNRGIEASISALYAAARHEWVFLNSADRQWPMDSLVPMAHAADAGADVVVGVRHNKRDVYTAYRRVISAAYEGVVRALGAPGSDPGSIKLGRASILRMPVAARGVFAEGERLIRASRHGYHVAEVPVDFAQRRAGKATGARARVVAGAIADVFRVTSSLAVGSPRPRAPVCDAEPL